MKRPPVAWLMCLVSVRRVALPPRPRSERFQLACTQVSEDPSGQGKVSIAPGLLTPKHRGWMTLGLSRTGESLGNQEGQSSAGTVGIPAGLTGEAFASPNGVHPVRPCRTCSPSPSARRFCR